MRDAGQRVEGIVEHKDATAEQKLINEVNAGIYVVDAKFLWGALERLTPPTRRASCTSPTSSPRPRSVGTVAVIEAPAEETAGVNDRAELADRAEVIRHAHQPAAHAPGRHAHAPRVDLHRRGRGDRPGDHHRPATSRFRATVRSAPT